MNPRGRGDDRRSGHLAALPITSISSATLRRWSALFPLDRVLDAMRHVIAQDFLLDPAQRRAHRADLRHDVDAVAVVLDHAGKPAHLAFDALQPLEGCRLASFAIASIYPLGVY